MKIKFYKYSVVKIKQFILIKIKLHIFRSIINFQGNKSYYNNKLTMELQLKLKKRNLKMKRKQKSMM